jgi:hypothetical protein
VKETPLLASKAVNNSSPVSTVWNRGEAIKDLLTAGAEKIEPKETQLLREKIVESIKNESGFKAKAEVQLYRSAKIMVLPSVLFDHLEDIRMPFVYLATELGYEMFKVNTNEVCDKLPDSAVQLIKGITYFCVNKEPVNIRTKRSEYEVGRTLAYALSLLGSFSHSGRQDFLIRNFEFIGNCEQKLVKGQRPVTQKRTELIGLFGKLRDSQRLVEILESLLKEYGEKIFPPGSSAFKNAIIPFQDYVRHHHTTRVHVRNKGGNLVKKDRVPGKPSSRSLFTEEEFRFILRTFSSLFTDFSKSWENDVQRKDPKELKSRLETHYNTLREFNEGFSRVTTSRLDEVRKVCSLPKDTRKNAVNLSSLTSALNQRDSPTRRFLEELFRIHRHALEEVFQRTFKFELTPENIDFQDDRLLMVLSAIRESTASEPYKSDPTIIDSDCEEAKQRLGYGKNFPALA